MTKTLDYTIMKLVTRRYYSLRRRSLRLSICPPILDDIKRIFQDSLSSGFACVYCGHELLLNEPYPHPFTPSVDHKLPLSHGGTNSINNMVICCHRCNIVKGTCESDIYIELIDALKTKPHIQDIILNGMFEGCLANKLERLEWEHENV